MFARRVREHLDCRDFTSGEKFSILLRGKKENDRVFKARLPSALSCHFETNVSRPRQGLGCLE
jgi:hypothetical protein